MRRRTTIAAAYAVLLGAWLYLEQGQIDIYSQAVFDVLHTPLAGAALLAITVAVGFLVGRWWVVATLAGPLLSLGYLQATGYVSPWHDGQPPLSIYTFLGLAMFAALLLLGVAGRRLWAYARSRSLRSPGVRTS